MFRILFLCKYAVRITSTKYLVQSKRGKKGKKSASKETSVPTSIESREFELSILLDPQCLSSHATYLQSMLLARRYLKTFAISAANFSEFLSTLWNSTEGFRYRFATSTGAGGWPCENDVLKFQQIENVHQRAKHIFRSLSFDSKYLLKQQTSAGMIKWKILECRERAL